MTDDISTIFSLRRTEGNNADYVRTGKLFALNARQADEVIRILTVELDPRDRRPYSLYLDRNALAAAQQQRIEAAIAPHTRRRIDVVDLSQPDTAALTHAMPSPLPL